MAITRADLASLFIKKTKALVVKARLQRMSSKAMNIATELY